MKVIDNGISIIVPVYNVEKYLKRCVESIINQTYKNLEIILIDDGSTDNSGKICDEYALMDNRVKVLHIKNGGVSNARNLGIENATGEYIAFVDSDDYLEKEMYAKMLNKAQKEDADLVFCKYRRFDEQGKYINVNDEEGLIQLADRKDIKCFFVKEADNIVWGTIWRSLYKKCILQNLRFDLDIYLNEDFIFILRAIMSARRIFFLNEYLYNYYFPITWSKKYIFKPGYELNNKLMAVKLIDILNENGLLEIAHAQYYKYYMASVAVIVKYKKKYKQEIKKLIREDDFYKKASTKFCYKNYLKVYGHGSRKQRILNLLIYKKMFFTYKLLINLNLKLKKIIKR